VDNLTHTVIGIGVSRAGLSQRFGPGTTLTLAIASNLPDVDVLWSVWDPMDRFLLRRTQTHALIALPLLAALLASALRWRRPDRSWPVLFGLSALGIGLHLLFDLVNSFGVVLLWPFSPDRFELSSIFIIDLCIPLLMIAPMIASRFLKTEIAKRRAYQAAVAALGLYAILCSASHARAEAMAREDLARRNLRPEALSVFPEPLGPHRFRAAARVGGTWFVSICHVLCGRVEPREEVPTAEGAPRVAELRATPLGRRLDRFMAAPVWTLRPGGGAEVYDLRFNSLVVVRKGTFVVEFPPGGGSPAVK
jgi:inner membrane protein